MGFFFVNFFVVTPLLILLLKLHQKLPYFPSPCEKVGEAFFWDESLKAISDVVAPPPVAIKGVQWVMDGPKFACNVDGCDASYMAKYNLVRHLRVCHNVTMELGKRGRPSTREQGPRVQDHATMNLQVLNNPLA